MHVVWTPFAKLDTGVCSKFSIFGGTDDIEHFTHALEDYFSAFGIVSKIECVKRPLAAYIIICDLSIEDVDHDQAK